MSAILPESLADGMGFELRVRARRWLKAATCPAPWVFLSRRRLMQIISIGPKQADLGEDEGSFHEEWPHTEP